MINTGPYSLWGYDVGHFNIGYRKPAPTLSIKVKQWMMSDRPIGHLPTAVVDLSGLVYSDLWPDPKSTANMISASIHRFGCDIQLSQSKHRRLSPQEIFERNRFTDYAKAFIDRIRPVRNSDIPDHETWISELTSYSRLRQNELLSDYLDNKLWNGTTKKCKSFIKWESYLPAKSARGINSYSDGLKYILGPLCHAIDKATFRTRWFVKGTDPRELPKRMESLFGNRRVMETDYSSFEANHSDYLSMIEWYWFQHMASSVIGQDQLLGIINDCVLGYNVSRFKYLTAKVAQRLMSGALWTSSSNGMLNLLITSYMVMSELHPTLTGQDLGRVSFSTFIGLVEGDDGICAARQDISNERLRRLGLWFPDADKPSLKFAYGSFYGDVSFCGKVMDRESSIVLACPLKVLAKIFVLPMKYAHSKQTTQWSLIRARAMSYKTQYTHAPVIGKLCDKILYFTRGIDTSKVRDLDWYHHGLAEICRQEKLWQHEAIVPGSSRIIVARKFGITVDEQIDFESRIDAWSSIEKPLILPLGSHIGPDQAYFMREFILPVGTTFIRPKILYTNNIVYQTLRAGYLKAEERDPLAEFVESHRVPCILPYFSHSLKTLP